MFYKGDSVFICILLLTLAPNSTGFGFFASDNGAKVMPVDTHDTVDTFLPAINSSLLKDCICMTEKRLCNQRIVCCFL